MRCPVCQQDNPEGSRICFNCGASLFVKRWWHTWWGIAILGAAGIAVIGDFGLAMAVDLSLSPLDTHRQMP